MKITENFDSDEFKCKCGKCNLEIDKLFVTKLQSARDIAKIPFTILSGCSIVTGKQIGRAHV